MLDTNRLINLRKQHDMTQEDVAEKLNTSRPNYVRYERGNHQPPNDTLILIADIFNVSTDYLLGKTDDSTPPNIKIASAAMTTEEAIIAIFKSEKGREPTDEELNMFKAFTKPVLDSLPDKAN